MRQIRVSTPSRLHFGLLGWGPGATRQFGGLGLMVDDPGLELLIEPDDAWSAEGPLSRRAIEVSRSLVERLVALGYPARPARVRVIRATEEHVGLGVGTQLSLALAAAHCRLAGLAEPTVEQLASLTGRGARSGVGLHGFIRGGFILDGGRRDKSSIPVLLSHLLFPENWSVFLVSPRIGPGLSGAEERRAFRDLVSVPQETTDRLCRLVLQGVLPALIEEDLNAFGSAIHSLQRVVGTYFAPIQGGIYAESGLESLVQTLHSIGLVGVGQSSWGPTLYGFTDAPVDERTALLTSLRRRTDLLEFDARWTRASRAGAFIEES